MTGDTLASGVSWISLMIALPWLGAILQAFLPANVPIKGQSGSAFSALIALLASSLSSIVVLFSIARLSSLPDLQLNEIIPWIASYSIHYDMLLVLMNFDFDCFRNHLLQISNF